MIIENFLICVFIAISGTIIFLVLEIPKLIPLLWIVVIASIPGSELVLNCFTNRKS